MFTTVLIGNLQAFFYYYVRIKEQAICSLLSSWSSLRVAAVNIDFFTD